MPPERLRLTNVVRYRGICMATEIAECALNVPLIFMVSIKVSLSSLPSSAVPILVLRFHGTMFSVAVLCAEFVIYENEFHILLNVV